MKLKTINYILIFVILTTIFGCNKNDTILKQELVHSGNIYHFNSKPYSGTALDYNSQGKIKQKIQINNGNIKSLINYEYDGTIIDSITLDIDGSIDHAFRRFKGINYYDSWNYSVDVNYPKADYAPVTVQYYDDLPDIKTYSEFINEELKENGASPSQLYQSNAVGRATDKFLFNHADGDNFFEFITSIPRNNKMTQFDLQFCCLLCGQHDGGSFQETITSLVISPRLIEGYFADYEISVLYADGKKETYYISDFNTFPIGVTDYITDSVDAVGNLYFLAGFSNDRALTLKNANLESSQNKLYLKVNRSTGDISGVIELNGISEHITLCVSRMELTQGYDRLYSDYMNFHKSIRNYSKLDYYQKYY